MNNWFAAAAAGVLALFGGLGGHGDRPTTTHDFNTGSTTHQERHATTTRPTLDISCVSAAVATREASLAAALSTYSSGVSSAYSVRAAALASAYSQSGSDAIRSAVKTVWKQFTSSMQGSKRAWQKSRESAWQTFRTAIKACGPNASSVADTANAGSELTGQ